MQQTQIRFTPMHQGRGWVLLDYGEHSKFTQGFFFSNKEAAQEQCIKLNEEFSHA
jgi:hypothetical protein